MDNIRVTLSIEGVGIAMDVHPIFSDDLKVKLSREEGQIFHRQSIEGTFHFVNEEFNLINECGENITFVLAVYRENSLVGTAKFSKSDCSFDYDNKNCSISLSTKDRYEDVLSHLDDEYNIVKLAPKTERIKLYRRGVLQLYVAGESTLTNIVGGIHFEQTATEETDNNTLVNTYHFRRILPLCKITIAPEQIIDQDYADLAGTYSVKGVERANEYVYYMTLHQDGGQCKITLTYVLNEGTATVFQAYRGDTLIAIGSGTPTIDFGAPTQGGLIMLFSGTYSFAGMLYARYLCPSKKTTDTIRRPTEDICDYDRNYPYVCPFPTRPTTAQDIVERLRMVTQKSSTPTSWGVDGSGQYFTSPILADEEKAGGSGVIPIGQSHWEDFSIWIVTDNNFLGNADRFNEQHEVRDAYPLWSVIQELAYKAANLGFNNDASEFLSEETTTADNPIGTYGFIRSDRHRLFITPITNIKHKSYEQASQRGDISLRKVFDMLRNAFQCYWWIDDYGVLRIEHISYFKNGNTYKETAIVPSIDVTQMLDYPTRKLWSFGVNKIDYEKNDLPSRYEFGWGEACSEAFNGTPIDIKDKVVGNETESVTVDSFLTDIDYILAKPNEVNNDLFALIETDSSKNTLISDVRLSSMSPIYRMQNGLLSFIHLEKTYHSYDLSGWDAYVDGMAFKVNGVKPIKKQSLAFPCPIDKISANGIIRTGLGDGAIERMETSISTLTANADIKLMAERDYSDKVIPDYRFVEDTMYTYLTNNSDRILAVTYIVYIGGIAGSPITITLVIGERRHILTRSRFDPAQIAILNAEDASPVAIGRFAFKTDGVMTHTIDSIDGKIRITFDGNKRGDYDFGMTTITARKDITITMKASTEGGYDYGWVDREPRGANASHGIERAVSGTDELTFTLAKGESRYIGYTKDASTYERNDTIVFEIE